MDKFRRYLQVLVLPFFLLSSQVGRAAPIAIAQEPLFLGGVIDPNIMFILDDSGSMQFESLPDDGWTRFIYPHATSVYGGADYDNRSPAFVSETKDFYGNVLYTDTLGSYSAWSRSNAVNKLYYNPETTYTPWVNSDGAPMADATPSCAYHNPVNTSAGCRNLTAYNKWYNEWWFSDSDIHTLDRNTGTTRRNGWQTFWPAIYYQYKGSGSLWDISSYVPVEIKSSVATYSDAYSDRSGRTDCAAAPSCTYAEEIQNFANWYTYYRSRVLLARNGIGKAFAAQATGLRVGFAAINHGSDTVDGFSSPGAIIDGLRPFSGTDRVNFFSTLYGHTIPKEGTPLRRALDAVGQYYEWKDNRGPWGKTPGTDDSTAHYECRQSFAVLMTDGYWNGFAPWTLPAQGNVDNASGPTITSPEGDSYHYTPAHPYLDAWSATLADVAMYYWYRDLQDGLDNKVPTSASDPAFWQHMVTYTVGLGVAGNLNPDTDLSALTGDPTKSPPIAPTMFWPQPTTSTDQENVDDLWHAALNSRGEFFSADDPEAFASQLENVLSSIGRRVSSAAAIATNSTRLNSTTFIYQARFDSTDWHGQLLAYQVDQNTADIAGMEAWDAGTLMPAAASRTILTHDSTLNSGAGGGADFVWADLNTAEQTYLIDGGTTADGQARLAYLRGDQSNELKNSGTYRNRTVVLGDIVNSDPWYVGQQNFGYHILPGTEGSSYLTFRASSAYLNRSKIIYVGANDGMIHAFDAATGVEKFAYVPEAVFPKLADLTDPNYGHRYFVDGSPKAGDAYVGSAWKTVLVGTLGGGGKAVFALDVTAPDSMTSDKVMWEITDTTAATIDGDGNSMLGYTMGQASIARMANGHWAVIFGNGYNSASNRAVLFIKDLEDGTLIALDTKVGDPTNPNGLATPTAVDENSDGIVDAIFAGDLRGNVWHFDVSDVSTGQWKSAYKSGNDPAPVFTALDPSGNRQPITSKIEVGAHPVSGVMLYFGTGKYIETSDVTSNGIQTLYGVLDDGATVSGRSVLQKQEILLNTTQDYTTPSNTTETYNLRVTTENPVDYTADGLDQKGWYMDLVAPASLSLDADGNPVVGAYTQEGERVVANPILREGRILFTTMIPDANPCNFGGTSWSADLTAIDGARPAISPYDLNNDGSFDSEDYVQVSWDVNGDGIVDENDKVAASGKQSKVGITKTPAIIRVADREFRYAGGSEGGIERTTGARTAVTGRQSWKQIQ